MKAPELNYECAENLTQVLDLLAKHGDNACILAGGQSLMPTLNMRLSKPELLLDINHLDFLKGISLENNMIRIGALARHTEVMRSPIIMEHLPLIAEAMPNIGHVAVRNRGTFGGSIALADPAAELPACVLALNANIITESTSGRRSISANQYFKGLFETEQRPDELLVEVRIPRRRPDQFFAFIELSRRHGDFAIAGLACKITIQNKIISEARLVYFASEDKPTLASNAASAIKGKSWSSTTREAALEALQNDLDPIDNLQGSAEFKLHLQRVLTGRALDQAIERAKIA